jgi:hypothetical protein
MPEQEIFVMPKIAYSPNLTFEKMGLHNGRQRNGSVYHNSGWYVLGKEIGACPKIGWGDLAVGDILNIEKSLNEGEALFILHEEDSFWNFVTENPGIIGAFCKTAPTEKDPGLDYVREKVAGIVVKGAFLRVQTYPMRKTGEKYFLEREEEPLEETAILRKDIKSLLNIS